MPQIVPYSACGTDAESVHPSPYSSMIRRDALFSVSGYNCEAVEFAMSLALARVEEAGQSYGILVQTEQIK